MPCDTASRPRTPSKVTLVLGGIALVIGLLVALVGLFLALRPVLGVYAEALNDPMGNDARAVGTSDPLADGKQVAHSMIPGLAIMAVGVVVSIAGSVMLKVGLIRRLARAQALKSR
ncbi:MAG: hypothetical protein IPK69_04345 [Phycisphaerales bacterium]|nr:MAG: hypothetical protein IPK69_04345 [Phycisphaerales bacterium]